MPVYEKDSHEIDLNTLGKHFKEKANEKLDDVVLKKLNLLVVDQERQVPINTLILLSDDDLRQKLFPYSKIECAGFKGTIPGTFIDKKTIDDPISTG